MKNENHNQSQTLLSYVFISLFLLISISASGYNPIAITYYSGGSGTSGDPYQITTAEDLIELSQTTTDWTSGKYFEQTADIDFGEDETLVDWNDDGSADGNGTMGFTPIGTSSSKFNGYYDGGNYSISNLYINTTTTQYSGLFGFISGLDADNKASLSNINLSSAFITVDISQSLYTGALIGLGKFSDITNCSSSGNIIASTSDCSIFSGGLIGSVYDNVSISQCASSVSVTANEYATICHSTCATGGLIGNIGTQISVDQCHATGDVFINTQKSKSCAGGLIGYSYTSSSSDSPIVSNCYATGNATANSTADDDYNYSGAGGLIGYAQQNIIINNCYATGIASGESENSNLFVGGCIGFNASSSIINNSYCLNNYNTDAIGGGLTTGATEKTQKEMTTQALYINNTWDFDTKWGIISEINEAYPIRKSDYTWYSITYNNIGTRNANNNPSDYATEGAITLEEAKDSTAYTFGGWFTNEELTDTVETPAIAIGNIGEKSFYVKWTAAEYPINYINVGTKNNVENSDFYIITDELTLATPNDSTGYTFAGWFTNEEMTDTVETPVIAIGNIGEKSFYVKWTIIEYPINYMNVGTKNNVENSDFYTITDELTLATPNDSTGYTFNGWFTNEEMTDTVETPAIAVGSTENTTFYAKWEVTEYSITYANIGTKNKIENVELYTIYDELTLSTPEDSASYTFGGWFTNEELTDTVETPAIAEGSTGDITFYAKWSTKYVVSGAGDSGVNGIYSENGLINGKMSYKYESNSVIYYLFFFISDFEDDAWVIDKSTSIYSPAYSLYYATSTATTPPSSDWETGMSGMSPFPIVEIQHRSITYSIKDLVETKENSGEISTSITITHSGIDNDSFAGENGEDFVTTGKVNVLNLPSGLSALITKISADTLEFSITGSATNHTNNDDISNLTLEFTDAAFIVGNASGLSNYLTNDISINFFQEISVGASGADYTTIKAAIAAADNYDIINILAGTYTENDIYIDKALTLIGDNARNTIVQASATAFTADANIFTTYSLDTVKFYNMTLRHGDETRVNKCGPAIFAQSSIEIYNCYFYKNQRVTRGSAYGGAVVAWGSLIMHGCLFEDNEVVCTGTGSPCVGGAVSVSHDSEFINCTFVNNKATSNNTNTTSTCGGALSVYTSDIINCTFYGNSSDGCGGAISGYSANIINSIFDNNTAITGSDIYRKSRDLASINNLDHCIYTGSLGALSGDCINGTNTNNSTDAPMLISLADNGGQTNTMALQNGSPAIDAGLDNETTPDIDQRGVATYGIKDIGAYDTAIEYAINYYDIGTRNKAENSDSYIITEELTLATPNDSTAYNFAGWFTNEEMTDTVTTPAIAVGSTVETSFYAKWELITIMPDINTEGVTNIGTKTADVYGYINELGTPNPTAHGVCWSTSTDPSINDSKIDSGSISSDGESFMIELSGLDYSTTYYARAYATNTAGTAYGEAISFTTADSLIATTTNMVNSTYQISSDGSVSASVSGGIPANTKDAVIIANAGTNEVNGKYLYDETLSTQYGCDVYLMGNYIIHNYEGGWLLGYFGDDIQYYTDQRSRENEETKLDIEGVIWSINNESEGTSPAPTQTIEKGAAPYTYAWTGPNGFTADTAHLVDLAPGKYYLTASDEYGNSDTSSVMVGYDAFATAPTVTSQAVSEIGLSTATANATITNLGEMTITERGIYYSATTNFADGEGEKVSTTGDWDATGAFTQEITGLNQNTTYYVKAFATNDVGTSYSEQVEFKTAIIVGLNKLILTNISIYPNPAKDLIHINTDEIITVEIINLEGRILLVSQEKDINISSLKSAVYIVKISTDGEQKMFRIVKE